MHKDSDALRKHLAPQNLDCPGFVRQTIGLAGTLRTASSLVGGAGPVLLLLSGGVAAGAASFFPVLPMLAARYRVVAVDLPGCGFTPSPPQGSGPETVERWLMDVLEAVQPAAVVGASIGGALALHGLAKSSRWTPPLVVVGSPAVTSWRPRLWPMLAMTAFAIAPSRLTLYLLALCGRARTWRSAGMEHFAAAALLAMRRPGGRDFLRHLRPFTRPLPDSALHALAEDQRVWGIWGQLDPFVEVKRLPRWLSVAVVPSASHYPFMDRPEAFVEVLRTVIEGCQGWKRAVD